MPKKHVNKTHTKPELEHHALLISALDKAEWQCHTGEKAWTINYTEGM